jgi:phosphate/sulfate permease
MIRARHGLRLRSDGCGVRAGGRCHLAFAVTNGFHDGANAIAPLVATRCARPGTAIALAAVFNLLGPLLLGAAVANTMAMIIDITAGAQTIPVVGAGLTADVAWNMVTWWRGLPSSSSHALVGGLVGAGVAEAGTKAINWGGFGGGGPLVVVIGAFVGLAISRCSASGRLGRSSSAHGADSQGHHPGKVPGAAGPTTRKSQWASWRSCCWHATAQSLSAPVWTKIA